LDSRNSHRHTPPRFRFSIVIVASAFSDTLKEKVLRARKVHNDVIVALCGGENLNPETIKDLDVSIASPHGKGGRGEAILLAAQQAGERGMTHIVTLDAENCCDLSDMMRLISALPENGAAIVIGNRKFNKSEMSLSARIKRRISRLWLRLQTGVALSDTGCGHRAYPLFVLENLKLKSKDRLFETEVLVKAAWAGIALLEISLEIPYHLPQQERQSPFLAAVARIRAFHVNAWFVFRSMAPVPTRKIVEDAAGKKISIFRPASSIKNLLTENATPVQLALATALGVFLGTLPLIGFHTIAILAAANFFRLNKVVSISASQLCMPPIVPALCIETGFFLRHGKFLTEFSIKTLGYQAHQRLYEWLIGSLLLAPILAILAGCLLYVVAELIKRNTTQVQR
jgi:uncharacterized protein (DUF2062 family)